MFLNYLDSSIGFVVVILLFSLLITVFVQAVSQLLQLRGKTLLRGVALILKEVDPGIGEQAQTLAEKVLRHPAIAEGKDRLATALRPEELQLILSSLASAQAASPRLQALVASGAALEKGIQDWFETVMDRTAERFKMRTRWVTGIFAVLLAFGLNIDSIGLFQTISGDPKLRGNLVGISDDVLKTGKEILGTPPAPANPNAPPAPANPNASPPPAAAPASTASAQQKLEAELKQVEQLKAQIQATGLPILPDHWWCQNTGREWLGVLVTAFLLGLGAPFWYNALRNLVGLRNVVAQKQDQKTQAQTQAQAQAQAQAQLKS
ncbi:MAG TPA: hypothetical protein VN783_03210 [Thermoanaerobaculia bacterium]|nr:hypothetical protein [Thermoanaerobaculia bacterium]